MEATKKKYLIVGVVVVLLFSVGSVAYFKFKSGNETKMDSPVQTEVSETTLPEVNTQNDQVTGNNDTSNEPVVLEGTEKYPTNWSEGLTKKEVVEKMNADSMDQVQLENRTVLEGTEKYPTNWSEGLTKKEVVEKMNAEIDKQNLADNVTTLEAGQ